MAKGAEETVARSQESILNLDELVEKSRVQAENFVQNNPERASVFISAGLRDKVIEAENSVMAAKHIARTEPQFTNPDIESLDHQAALIIAIAEELNMPEYNQ